MGENNLTLLIIALIGFLQIALGIYSGRRNNKASAERDSASATEAIGSSYSALVIRLESRLNDLEEDYKELKIEHETLKLEYAGFRADCNGKQLKWEEEREELMDLVRGLQSS